MNCHCDRQLLGNQSLKKKLTDDKPKGEMIGYRAAANADVIIPTPMMGWRRS